MIDIASYTGTRWGMTSPQALSVERLMLMYGLEWIVHGMCKGGDSQVDQIAKDNGIKREGWPANADSRQFCDCEIIHPVKRPLDRDKDIVDRGKFLIAGPKDDHEIIRSGTWSTVRYARKLGRPIYIVKRDGTIVEERTDSIKHLIVQTFAPKEL